LINCNATYPLPYFLPLAGALLLTNTFRPTIYPQLKNDVLLYEQYFVSFCCRTRLASKGY